MKHLILFESFNRPYIDRRAMASRKPVEIGYLKQPVEIRIENKSWTIRCRSTIIKKAN